MTNHENWEKVKEVCGRLIEAGFETYLVGGCVRDSLLHRSINDFDVATSASPKQVHDLFERVVLVGEAFGVCRVILENISIEVAQFRKDLETKDHRRPLGIIPSDVKEDAERRDFTMNALFMDPKTFDVIDFVDGEKDIQKRTIRTVGLAEERFKEDYLRVLRAVRFAAQLGFKIENRAYFSIVKLKNQLSSLSSERVSLELSKIMSAQYCIYGLQLLKDTGLWEEFFKGFELKNEHWSFFKKVFKRINIKTFEEGLALFFGIYLLRHTCCKDMDLKKISEKIKFFKLAKQSQDFIQSVLVGFVTIRNFSSQMDVLKLLDSGDKGIFFKKAIRELGECGFLDKERVKHVLALYENLSISTGRLPLPVIKGQHLLDWGYEGRLIGSVLTQCYEAQLMGEFDSLADAESWVKKNFKSNH